MGQFRKVLIANRGEIALRIIRACHELGLSAVVVYSEADTQAQHVLQADEAVCIGEAAPQSSYLNTQAILDAAQKTGAEAIHPGYGFLSENADFARSCQEAGLIFIGPAPQSIEKMGSKIAARQWVEELGVPVIPGYHGSDQSIETLKQKAHEIGYPLLLKASAGGGGRGMRLLKNEKEFEKQWASAQREAQQAFGDGSLYLEKYLPEVRHIEFQILGDSHGNVIHCFERECSLQRRYQKIIEESPSPALSSELRQEMGDAAVRIAKALNYQGAGTVEFVLEKTTQAFYFLEVNTRLQVEHPITEAVTGLDLVHWQFKIAAGEALFWKQSDLIQRGHAIECRICAEDTQFAPASGQILALAPPELPYVRWDGGFIRGDEIGVNYDSMLAKLIVWGESRERCLLRMDKALSETQLLGIESNLHLLRKLIQHPDVYRGELSTRFIETHGESLEVQVSERVLLEAAIVSRLARWKNHLPAHLPDLPRKWSNNHRLAEDFKVRSQDKELQLSCQPGKLQNNVQYFTFFCDEQQIPVKLYPSDQAQEIQAEIDGVRRCYHFEAPVDLKHIENQNLAFWLHCKQWGNLKIELLARFPITEQEHSHGGYRASMPAKILQILVEEDQKVEADQPLIIMESMKMETTLHAAEAGVITSLNVSEGQTVEKDYLLLILNN